MHREAPTASALRLPKEPFFRRSAGIDLVRGISIVLVVIHHVALRIPLTSTSLANILPRPLLLGLSSDGYEAVFVFFVVSGFLITDNAVERWGALSSLRPRVFYVRRAARILPCLLVLIVVLSVLDLLRLPDYAITRVGQSLPRAIVSALAFHLNWYEGRTGYLPGGWDVLWSLSIEEVFYLGFPIACMVLGRHRLVMIVLFGTFASCLPGFRLALAHAPEIWSEKAYLPGMAAIAAGVCTALIAPRAPRPRGNRMPAVLGWFGVLLLASFFWWEDTFFRLLGDAGMLVLTGGTSSLMLAFAGGWGRTRAATGTAWLRSFGRLSYEIYLTHMFVVFAIVRLFKEHGGDRGTGWIWFAPALGLSWMLGWLVDRSLSRPADRWIRRSVEAWRPA